MTDPARLEYERGLGIPLIRALVDEVEFRSSAEGTSVRLAVRCGRAEMPFFQAWSRFAWVGLTGVAVLAALAGRPGEHPFGHGRALHRDPSLEHFGARRAPRGCRARPAPRPARQGVRRAAAADRRRRRRVRGNAWPAPSPPPARAASSWASSLSGAGFRLAGSPSYQPPYSRQMLRTMNSGSSYTGCR